jgi:hypothetical protein
MNGHLFGLDVSHYSDISYNYKIGSKKLKPTNSSCVSFWYHMRGLQYKEELIFYLKKDNAVEEAVSSFVIEEMGAVFQSYNMTFLE